tara:strand:+ start:268 stop:594 length:327 start_codon:yes stop_codon:yes gene_type:complete
MNIIELTWEDIMARIEYVKRKNKIKSNTKIYGVPKNGMIITSFFGCVSVYDPEKADFIIDDIIDSGKTKKNIKNYIQKRNLLLYLRKTKRILGLIFHMKRIQKKTIKI